MDDTSVTIPESEVGSQTPDVSLAEVRTYMDVTGVQPSRILGRLREPVNESIRNLTSLFRRSGLLAYFRRFGEGHEIALGPVPRPKPARRWVNLVLFIGTIGTTLLVGALQSGHNPLANPGAIVHGIPFSLAIILILGSHEFGHYLTARRLGVDATLPYFLPVPHPMTGTMGAFIRIRSAVPSRGALLRVGVAGPLVGFIVAIPVMLVGLAMSRTVVVGEVQAGIQLGSPLIVLALTRLWFGPLASGIDIVFHPVAFAGWLGFLVTALNLLPVGQLDGGHIAYAFLGRHRKTLNWAVLAALVLLGFFWLGWPFWAIMISVFGLRHPRPLDDITPLRRTEKVLAVLALVILVASFTPVPFGAARF